MCFLFSCDIVTKVSKETVEFILLIFTFFLDWLSTKSNSNQFYKEEHIMEDITLTCKDCGAEFVFTAGEQQFYAEKGFTNQPVRCPACRKARKQRNNGNY